MLWWCLLLPFLGFANAKNLDDDLMSFVTLPDVRALKLDIAYYDRGSVSPGYWFVAPYGVIEPEAPTKQWKPCQVGPYIYDADGVLVWAGSCMFDNRNIFDFKVVDNIDDQPHLSFILQHAYGNSQDKGTGYILDQHYEPEYAVQVTNDLSAFNMHEFNVLPGGKTALACAYRSEYVSLGDLGRPDEYGWVQPGGFVEVDTTTGNVLFEWSSLGHIPLHESVKVNPWDAPALQPGWDFLHVNSIDKNEDGDYILSARFTNTIYLISGDDGHIIWRLGGKYSDFVQDFTFSKQHHVHFVQSDSNNTVISFLNNASDELEAEEDTSAALFVEIDTTTTPMNAREIRRHNRPDGSLTRLRGSVQHLPNDNVFVGWSERGYMSEHSPEGKTLMQASFASTRFSSYRSYKYPFIGRPFTPPDMVSSVYGTSEDDFMTVFYVSWNGATDIAMWNFYARSEAHGIPVLVGNTRKTDFETLYVANGYLDYVTAEAVDADGNVLGTSDVHRTATPENWQLSGFQGESKPVAADPSILYGQQKAPEADIEEPVDDKVLEAEKVAKAMVRAFEMIKGIGGLLIFILVTGSGLGLVVGVVWYLRRRRMLAYHEVPSQGEGEE